MLAARREHGITMITPQLGDSSRQTKTGNGYSRDDLTIYYDTRTATCPQGQTSATWNTAVQDGIEKICIAFPQRWRADYQRRAGTEGTKPRTPSDCAKRATVA